MENLNKGNTTDKVSKNPKPSDEVQLEIETVTPDTEKDVKPTVNSSDKQVVEPVEEDVNNGEQVETVNEDTVDELPLQSKNTRLDNETTTDKDNDERDQIETISP